MRRRFAPNIAALYGSGGGGASVTLADLQAMFGAGDDGGLYVANDLTKMFQDISGGTTTAVAANGDLVGTWQDVSGKGRHLSASATGNRLTYNANAGKPRLRSNATASLFTAALTAFNVHTRISALQSVSHNGTEGDIFVDRSGGGSFYLYQVGASGNINTENGTDLTVNLPIGTDGVILEVRNATLGALAKDAVPGAPAAAYSSVNQAGLMVGGLPGSHTADFYIYGAMFINRVLTNVEIAKVLTYMGALQGRTL